MPAGIAYSAFGRFTLMMMAPRIVRYYDLGGRIHIYLVNLIPARCD